MMRARTDRACSIRCREDENTGRLEMIPAVRASHVIPPQVTPPPRRSPRHALLALIADPLVLLIIIHHVFLQA